MKCFLLKRFLQKNLLLGLPLLAFLSAFLLVSCSGSVYKQPVFASTSVLAVPPYKELGKVEQRACDRITFFWMSGQGVAPLYQKALEEAQEMGADGLVNFSVRSESYTGFWLWPFVFASECFVASGTAVRFVAQDGASDWDASPLLAPDTLKTPNKESLWDAPPM
jgi:hypothetical protein